MKFLLAMLLLPFASIGQKLILLDRRLQQPITATDTFTMEQASKGILPVYRNDIESIINAMQALAKTIGNGEVTEEALDVPMGNSMCVVRSRKNAGIQTHNIVLTTTVNGLKTAITIADHETAKRALQRLVIFLDYLRNNFSVLEK